MQSRNNDIERRSVVPYNMLEQKDRFQNVARQRGATCYMRLLCRRAIHASPPTRWKIRKSHSGSLDNPAVLMFLRIPLTHTSRPRPLSLRASSIRALRFPSVFACTPASSDDPVGTLYAYPSPTRRDATRRAVVGKRDGSRSAKSRYMMRGRDMQIWSKPGAITFSNL